MSERLSMQFFLLENITWCSVWNPNPICTSQQLQVEDPFGDNIFLAEIDLDAVILANQRQRQRSGTTASNYSAKKQKTLFGANYKGPDITMGQKTDPSNMTFAYHELPVALRESTNTTSAQVVGTPTPTPDTLPLLLPWRTNQNSNQVNPFTHHYSLTHGKLLQYWKQHYNNTLVMTFLNVPPCKEESGVEQASATCLSNKALPFPTFATIYPVKILWEIICGGNIKILNQVWRTGEEISVVLPNQTCYRYQSTRYACASL